MLTEAEKSQIRQILGSPQWQMIVRFVELLKIKVKEQPVIGDTEWDTIKNLLINEGRVQGLSEFVQEFFNNANHESA